MNKLTNVKPSVGAESDEFFVGYLPTPPRLSRWLKRAVMAIVAVVVVTAAVVAALQNDPGDAVWTLDQEESWEGVLIARPYPMLKVTGPNGTRTLLLVSEGKQGVMDRLPAHDCDRVRVKGTLLQRDGRQMIELVSRDDAFVILSADAPDERLRLPASIPWQPIELRGEIIDPKCYLGAMKPGEGKTHKACAALCLLGGIPPMFVSTDEQGRRTYYLLVAEAQKPVDGDALEAFVSLVGDAVRLKGHVAAWGDLQLLKVNPDDVVRE